jgi:DNA-binding MarR family transcriptional regulator
MKNLDNELLEIWQKGDSIGSIAKRFKLDKSQVKRMINRAIESRKFNSSEVLQQLPADETNSEG